MRILVLYFFLVSYQFSNSQVNYYDSLKKYTYTVLGVRSINLGLTSNLSVYPLGSCFFIRNGQHLYLITAKHVINGFDTFNNKPTEKFYDTIAVRYINESNDQKFRGFNIKLAKEVLQNDYYYKIPDVAVLEIEDTTLKENVLSIENYSQEGKILKEINDSIIAIGYGVMIPKTYTIKTPPIYGKGFIPKSFPKTDTYHQNDSLFYIAYIPGWGGMSGSPVFIVKSQIKGKVEIKNIYFNGVLFGGDKMHNLIYVVNSEIVNNQIFPQLSLIDNYFEIPFPDSSK